MTIKVSTSGNGGKTMKKKVTIITDDPDNDQIPLTISGRVIEIYTISAKSVKLTGTVGEKLQETIHLVPSREYPFTVKEVTAKYGKDIRFQLKEAGSSGDVQYDLTVENIATDPKVYFDTLQLKTDSEIKPEIDIPVVGRIQAAATTTEAAGIKNGADTAGDL